MDISGENISLTFMPKYGLIWFQDMGYLNSTLSSSSQVHAVSDAIESGGGLR